MVMNENINNAFEELRARQQALQDASTYKTVLAAIQLMAKGPEREQQMIDDRFEELAVRECRINALHEHVEKMKTIKGMIMQVENIDEKTNALRQRYLRVVLRIREHISECDLEIGSTRERDKFLYRFVDNLEKDTEDQVGKMSEGQRFREALKQVKTPKSFDPEIDTPRIWWKSLLDYFEFHNLNTKERIFSIRGLLPHKFQETIWSTLENRSEGMTYTEATFGYIKDQYFAWFDTLRHEEQANLKLESLSMSSKGDQLESLMTFYNEFVALRVLSKCDRPPRLAAKMFLEGLNPRACDSFIQDMRKEFPWNTGTPELMLAHAKTLLLNARAVDLAVAKYNGNNMVNKTDYVHNEESEYSESISGQSSDEERFDAAEDGEHEAFTDEEEYLSDSVSDNGSVDTGDDANGVHITNKRTYYETQHAYSRQQAKRTKRPPIKESKGEKDTITTPVKDRRVGNEPTDRCKLHPDRFHTNERCFLQHPEIAPWGNIGGGNNLQKSEATSANKNATT